jgi:hypothetical protein
MTILPGDGPTVGFDGERNITMKFPPHLGRRLRPLVPRGGGPEPIDRHTPTVGFKFGANQLWIDRVEELDQAEVWLDIHMFAEPDHY